VRRVRIRNRLRFAKTVQMPNKNLGGERPIIVLRESSAERFGADDIRAEPFTRHTVKV